MAKKSPSSRNWFHSDESFWGWYPASWQGWLILVVYLGILLYSSWSLLPRANAQSSFDFSHGLLTWLAIVSAGVASLIAIVWKTGGKPHARR